MKQLTNEAARAALDAACGILHGNLAEFTDKFQSSNSEHNFYPPSDNVEWTTGFCTGEYWLAWEHTRDDAFKAAALRQVDSFLDRIERKIDVDHHDMGFLYTPSCVAAYKLTGSETGRKAALLAADQLCSRFREKGQFIQAWGPNNAADNYRLIIDCLLNLPLLYWASEVTGDPHYRDIAVAHTRTSVQNLVRPDHSTYHTFFFDPETGAPLRGATRQGYRDGSAWARGQAWGVYGMALSYRYTGDEACIRIHWIFQTGNPVFPGASARRRRALLGPGIHLRRRTAGFLGLGHRGLRHAGNGPPSARGGSRPLHRRGPPPGRRPGGHLRRHRPGGVQRAAAPRRVRPLLALQPHPPGPRRGRVQHLGRLLLHGTAHPADHRLAPLLVSGLKAGTAAHG